MVQILPAKQKRWWQALSLLHLKMLLPLLHGNNVLLLIKRLWRGEVQVTNLIRHYPYRTLYWQLHSNLSGPLIRWHNEIAAYLIYQVIFSCHLLVSKNKLSCLEPWEPSEDESHVPHPSSSDPEIWTAPPAAHRLSLATWKSSVQNPRALARQLPLLFLPLCSWPGTFRRHHSTTLPVGWRALRRVWGWHQTGGAAGSSRGVCQLGHVREHSLSCTLVLM